jgi:hypothetical protein
LAIEFEVEDWRNRSLKKSKKLKFSRSQWLKMSKLYEVKD